MTAAIEVPRRSQISDSSALLPSNWQLDARFRNRQIEFIAGLPYSSWDESDVHIDLAEWRALTATEEQHLFRQMNLAYFHAYCLRQKLTHCDDGLTATEIERLLARGDSIREQLAAAFYKLNYSIVSRYSNSVNTFDELVCEGHYTLLRAIAGFNPERGYRFSTYAMHAIRRRIFRFMHQRQRQREGIEAWSDSAAHAEEHRPSLTHEHNLATATAVAETLLLQLSPRERFVIRARFGWGREFEPRTLQQIADELGVSRERIRQLEQRALAKLRTLAEPLDVEL